MKKIIIIAMLCSACSKEIVQVPVTTIEQERKKAEEKEEHKSKGKYFVIGAVLIFLLCNT